MRAVPGLATVANPGGAQQTFSIRGIVGGTGAATTSVYLDDTNLTKRANGGVAQNNGVIAPLLYDLERVEVLKGPQGTLFGGSSEGGTVRYITPLPSLTEYSGSARAEVIDMGSRSELSNEVAAAFGGPARAGQAGLPRERHSPRDRRLDRHRERLRRPARCAKTRTAGRNGRCAARFSGR